MKLKAAAREQQKIQQTPNILQAGNINLGSVGTISASSPVPEMTELIHSSNLDSTSCASNVPLELISEMVETEKCKISSSDDETKEIFEEDDDDDEEITPTIMPLPITRETSKNLPSEENLDILS